MLHLLSSFCHMWKSQAVTLELCSPFFFSFDPWWDKRLFYLEIWINHIEMSHGLHLIAAVGIKPVEDFNALCKCCIFFLCKNSLRLTAFFWTICQFLYFWICGRIKITPTRTGNINDNIRFCFLPNGAATWIAPARIFSLCTTFLSVSQSPAKPSS